MTPFLKHNWFRLTIISVVTVGLFSTAFILDEALVVLPAQKQATDLVAQTIRDSQRANAEVARQSDLQTCQSGATDNYNSLFHVECIYEGSVTGRCADLLKAIDAQDGSAVPLYKSWHPEIAETDLLSEFVKADTACENQCRIYTTAAARFSAASSLRALPSRTIRI